MPAGRRPPSARTSSPRACMPVGKPAPRPGRRRPSSHAQGARPRRCVALRSSARPAAGELGPWTGARAAASGGGERGAVAEVESRHRGEGSRRRPGVSGGDGGAEWRCERRCERRCGHARGLTGVARTRRARHTRAPPLGTRYRYSVLGDRGADDMDMGGGARDMDMRMGVEATPRGPVLTGRAAHLGRGAGSPAPEPRRTRVGWGGCVGWDRGPGSLHWIARRLRRGRPPLLLLPQARPACECDASCHVASARYAML